MSDAAERKRQAAEDQQVEDAIREGVELGASLLGGNPTEAALRILEAVASLVAESMRPKNMKVDEGGKPTGVVDLGG